MSTHTQTAPPVSPPAQLGDTRSPHDTGSPSRGGEGPGEGPPPSAGGPRTPEGKAVASRNATTHGLFSRQTVLPHLGEDAEGYRQVLNALTEQFDPRTLMERQYLELWAEASWKLRRLARWEAQLWEQDGLDEDARLTKLERVLRLQTTLRRQLDKAVRMLSQDVPDVQKHYARRAVLASRSLTETDCRENPRIAYDVESAVQTEILCAPGLPDLDRSCLDTAAHTAAEHTENSQNEPPPPTDNKICQNEPVAAHHPSVLPYREDPCGGRHDRSKEVGSSLRSGEVDSEEAHPHCDDENCQNEPELAEWSGSPPLLDKTAMSHS